MKSLTKRGLRDSVRAQISLPLLGVLDDVKHAFFGLCVHGGRQVLAAMMEADRAALCGPRGVPNLQHGAVRGGTTRSKVILILGGQRIDVSRPRMRTIDAGELQLPSFQWAAAADPLNAAPWRRSPRACPRAATPPRSMGCLPASVRRRPRAAPFPAASWPSASSKLGQWLSRTLGELDLPVVMIDGIHFRDRVVLVALGIDAQGNTHVLGLRESSTEATRVVRSQSLDVPTRSAYVMSIVTPAERAAAASFTIVPRSLAAAAGPLLAGWLLGQSSFGWQLVIGGSVKLVYDALLYTRMRGVEGPPP